MSPEKTLLVIIDVLDDRHIARIGEIAGTLRVERLPFAASEDEYRTALERAEIVTGWPDAKLLLESEVRLFQLPSVGYDPYNGVGLDRKSGFVLCNARGVMDVPVAEHAVAMMFALTRRIVEAVRDSMSHTWNLRTDYEEVTGSRACVVGLGGIGTELARRLVAVGVDVVGVRRDPSVAHPLVSRVYGLSDLTEAVSGVNHVFSVIPHTPETDCVFSTEVLAAMPRGARFYNLSRGAVVDDDALVEALREGHLAGAGLDVFREEPLPESHPLWALPNVIVSPHAGGRSPHEPNRLCDLIVRNASSYLSGEPLANVVFPSL